MLVVTRFSQHLFSYQTFNKRQEHLKDPGSKNPGKGIPPASWPSQELILHLPPTLPASPRHLHCLYNTQNPAATLKRVARLQCQVSGQNISKPATFSLVRVGFDQDLNFRGGNKQ